MIAIESILHIVYSKNTGIYSGFCMCHILKDEDEDIYVIHPLLQVGPGRGGDHIYIYIVDMGHLDPRSIYLSIYLSIHSSIHPFIYLPSMDLSISIRLRGAYIYVYVHRVCM